MKPIAHTKNSQGKQQDLVEHLTQVAELAKEFAEGLGASDLAYYAGLLHDIGKFNPEFQQYLSNAEKGIKGRGPDHKGAGAVHAKSMELMPLAFLAQGHHGGLRDGSELRSFLIERKKDPAVLKAIEKAKQVLPDIDQTMPHLIPADIKSNLERELFIRLLFSCLVDADFLDTEQHFSPDKSIQRGSSVPIGDLWGRFEAYYREKTEKAKPSTVNDIRRQIYQHCYDAAELAPGFFRLTAPTGGGKTLSSLAFALRHAKLHNKQRIIYAIPFTSIIDQVAKEFKEIFSDDIVLEHHSSVTPPDDPNNIDPSEVWRRLSAENWDASVIVTTTVQLFQSLFANSTSTCRKLHNIAESVVVLDEVQLLPVHLLEPILDVLQQLAEQYRVTVVLCTATQPALENRMNFQGLKGIRDIISDPLPIFSALSRVEYQWCLQEQWTWQQVAERAKQSKQALIIINTKKDAIACAEAFDDAAVLHLSTSMCGLHRRTVLAEVKRRLFDDEPCYLVSTQLIEAGVDIDFPLVLRALCPLDNIVQAAGRCNRNGLLPQRGLTIIFDPAESNGLKGYRTGINTLNGMLREGTIDTEDPKTFQEYFQKFYSRMSLDELNIQESHKSLKYETVSKDFKMIENDTMPVVVRYDETKVDKILSDLQQSPYQAREIMRQLQPYMVSVRARSIEDAKKRYPISEHPSGVLTWIGGYDETYGIVDGAIFV